MVVDRIEIEYTETDELDTDGNPLYRAIVYFEKNKTTEVVNVPLYFQEGETEVEQVQRTLDFLSENLY